MKNFINYVTILLLFSFVEISYAQYVPKDKRDKKQINKDTTAKPPVETKTEEKKENDDKNKDGKSEVSQMSFKERLIFGGNVAPILGTDYIGIAALPLVGYRVTDKFNTGLGGTYVYTNQKVTFTNGTRQTFEQNYYGAKAFGQYKILPEFFLWGEIESINGELLNLQTFETKRQWFTSPLVGAGYNAGVFNIMLLYNLNYSDGNSIYASPWVYRTGFLF